MKKSIFLCYWFFTSMLCFSQKRNPGKAIALSVPILWNDTKIFNVYSGARATYLSGKAVSRGINAAYIRPVAHQLALIIGAGYFRQNFGIVRPFSFNGDTATKLLYHTKKYSYSNLDIQLGARYNLKVSNRLYLPFSLIHHSLFSFRQKYIPAAYSGQQFKNIQIGNRFLFFGQMLNLQAGAGFKISRRLATEAGFTWPFLTRWRKDRIFDENERGYQHSRRTAGINLSLLYNPDKISL